jgi:hypothetical protein
VFSNRKAELINHRRYVDAHHLIAVRMAKLTDSIKYDNMVSQLKNALEC